MKKENLKVCANCSKEKKQSKMIKVFYFLMCSEACYKQYLNEVNITLLDVY